ncbi:MAG: NAD(P)-dependent oxidoreductase, partial [Nonomuraea sp.]|nr:NAD(P)-dependent oxidoreductase [Nonomuraea sp.]
LTPSLGYTPTDDAEDYADRFPDADAFFAGGPQGGHFAAPGYTERHLG